MALSTLRISARWSRLLATQGSPLVSSSVPASSAHQQMKDFWKKNEELKRPSSPWMIYTPHLPMMTSLTHRTTGIVMGFTLYGLAITTFLAPGDFTMFLEAVKDIQLPKAVLFAFKSVCAFPLVYHYINGIRHLTWDTGRGFELATQYKSGWVIVASTVTIAALLGSLAYW